MDNNELTHKEYQEKYPEEFANIGGVLGEILLDRESGHDGVYALPQVTRFEIYGSGGGFKHAVTVEPGATLHIQDGGRTLKIFTKEHVEPGVWFQEEHDWGKRSTRDSSNSE